MNTQIDSDTKQLHILGHEIPALWLRERAQTEDQLDHQTGQRLFNPHSLDVSLNFSKLDLKEGKLTVAFSDGYQGNFDCNKLEEELSGAQFYPNKVLWGSDTSAMPRFNWHQLDDPATEFAAVRAYLQYGYIILEDTPTQDGGYFEIAKQFGFVKETAHGRSFEVVSVPNYNDLAYQPVALAPHTDMPYSNPMPGIQILQCRVNETTGGLSTLADSLACCAQLKQENPEGYQLLSKIAVRFEFHSKDEMITLEHPLLNTDEQGNLLGVRYSPRLDYLPLLDTDTTQKYQYARQRLGELFIDERFQLFFRLKQGEAMMFDNSRVLHGRTSYDPNEGHRHLQGGYLDGDGPKIRYNTLKRDHGFD